MKRVGLVSTDQEFLKGDADLEIGMINEALSASGIRSEIVVWHEERRWQEFDLLVFRSPWDYPERMSEFSRWLNATEQNCRILNSPELVRWNLDKRYLLDLAQRGVNCTPSVFCSSVDQGKEAIEQVLLSHEACIVKPNISVGSRNTGLFSAANAAALDLCEEILSVGKIPMVQAAIDTVQSGAERGLLYFNGRFSHAISKGAILQPEGGYLGGVYTENIAPASASAEEIELGMKAMAAIAEFSAESKWGRDARLPLYARIDVATPSDGEPLLLEAELFEPSIFVRHSEGGLERFVAAVHDRLAETGSGADWLQHAD